MEDKATNRSKSKPRPPLFRALGGQDPPSEIVVDGQTYQHERTIKHDSWAATALYANAVQQRIVCKFNRIQPIFLMPCRWLGRRLALREARMYQLLSDLPNISTGYEQVYAEGKRLPNAVAHDYIDGHPLRWHDVVKDDFFEQLRETLLVIHRRGIAYVDMHKCENIIVDKSGNPCLIDFQISIKLPRVWPLSSVLRVLQESDLYHLSKNAGRFHPQRYPEGSSNPPPWIKLHRKIANPFRAFRRRLLTAIGIRRGKGRAQSECFVEEGLRANGGSVKPIIQLYQQMGSEQYMDYAQSISQGRDFIDVAFADLLGRAPRNELEIKFVDSKRKCAPHDQIMSLLKSELFVVASQKWDDRFVDSRIQHIASNLKTAEPNRQAA